jgi:hypothetical protein
MAPVHPLPRRRVMPLLATGTTIALVVGMAVLGFMSDRGHPGADQSGTLKVPAQQGPIPFGVKTSASAAEASLSFRIPFPDVALANSSTLVDLWTDSVNQQFAATYSSGVTVTIKPNEYSDPVNALSQAADSINAKVSLVGLGSGTALVIEPDTDSTDGENPAWVEFVSTAGLDVNLYSDTLGVAELLVIARGIDSASG